MVEPTERNKVGRLRLAAIGPVLDMMRVDVARVRAAGKATALVARIQDAPERGRNCPRLATDIERLAIIVLDQSDDARVARQPTGGLGRHRRSVFKRAASGGAISQSFFGHVHHDLETLSAGGFNRAMRQEAFGYQGQCIRAARAERNRLLRRSSWNVPR